MLFEAFEFQRKIRRGPAVQNKAIRSRVCYVADKNETSLRPIIINFNIYNH